MLFFMVLSSEYAYPNNSLFWPIFEFSMDGIILHTSFGSGLLLPHVRFLRFIPCCMVIGCHFTRLKIISNSLSILGAGGLLSVSLSPPGECFIGVVKSPHVSRKKEQEGGKRFGNWEEAEAQRSHKPAGASPDSHPRLTPESRLTAPSQRDEAAPNRPGASRVTQAPYRAHPRQ